MSEMGMLQQLTVFANRLALGVSPEQERTRQTKT
jgi:hypothetical protein